MDSHFSLNFKIKLESNFSAIARSWVLLKWSLFNQIKLQKIVTDLRHRVQKKKETLKETSQETEINIKKVNVLIQWLVKKINLKLFIFNIEHKPYLSVVVVVIVSFLFLFVF